MKLTPSFERKMRKPRSPLELSVQVRLTWLALTTVAARPLGAAGTGRVVTLSVFEAGDSPAALVAVTR